MTSSRQTVTYRQVINRLVSYITGNCQNIDAKYDSLTNVVKNGYSYNPIVHSAYALANNNVGAMGCKCTLSSPIAKVTSATVTNEINTFCENIGLPTSAYDYPIDDTSYLKFMNNMAVFLSAKLAYVVGHNVTGSAFGNVTQGTTVNTATSNQSYMYLIYHSPNAAVNTSNIMKITPKATISENENYIISSTDIKTAMDIFFRTIKQSARIIHNVYSFSIW